MAFTKTNKLGLILPNPGQERGIWGQELNDNFKLLDSLVHISRHKTLSWFDKVPAPGEHKLLGFNKKINSDEVLPGPLVLDNGTSRLGIDIKTGTDLEGQLELTGTSRHSNTGEEKSDTETIEVNGAGLYVTQKYWKEGVSIDSSDLSISALDVYQLSWYDNDRIRFAIRKFRLKITSNTSGLDLTTTVKKVQKIGNTYVMSDVLSGELDISTTITSTQYWDLSLEIRALDLTGINEGIIVSLDLTGSSGDWEDLCFLTFYENRSA